MQLDRATITGRTFGRAGDGYDPAEVDRFLAEIAAAVEALEGRKLDHEAS